MQRYKKYKCADDGDGYRQHRYQGSTPTLEEQEHDYNNQRQGDKQRFNHLANRHLHDSNGFKWNHVVDISGERLFKVIHCSVNIFGGFQRIAVRRLVNQKVRCSSAVNKRVPGVVEFPQLYPRNILQMNNRPITGGCFNDHIGKLLRCRQPALYKD